MLVQKLAVVEPFAAPLDGNMSSPVDNSVALMVAEECLVTVAKVLDNILTETSYQKKTRKLKLTNQTFDRRVARHPGGIDFLIACQFTRTGQNLQLKLKNEDKLLLWRARLALHDRATSLGFGLPSMPPEPATAQGSSGGSQEINEAMSMYETSTICTLDELESEILKELEEDDIPPVSPKGAPVSPLGHSNVAASDRMLDHLSFDSQALSPLGSAAPGSPLPGRPPKTPSRSPSITKPAEEKSPRTALISQAPQLPKTPQVQQSPQLPPKIRNTDGKESLLLKPRTLKKKVEKLKKEPVVVVSAVAPSPVACKTASTPRESEILAMAKSPKAIPQNPSAKNLKPVSAPLNGGAKQTTTDSASVLPIPQADAVKSKASGSLVCQNLPLDSMQSAATSAPASQKPNMTPVTSNLAPEKSLKLPTPRTHQEEAPKKSPLVNQGSKVASVNVKKPNPPSRQKEAPKKPTPISQKSSIKPMNGNLVKPKSLRRPTPPAQQEDDPKKPTMIPQKPTVIPMNRNLVKPKSLRRPTPPAHQEDAPKKPAVIVDLESDDEGWGSFDDEDDLLKEMEAELDDSENSYMKSSLSKAPPVVAPALPSPRSSTGVELRDVISSPASNLAKSEVDENHTAMKKETNDAKELVSSSRVPRKVNSKVNATSHNPDGSSKTGNTIHSATTPIAKKSANKPVSRATPTADSKLPDAAPMSIGGAGILNSKSATTTMPTPTRPHKPVELKACNGHAERSPVQPDEPKKNDFESEMFAMLQDKRPSKKLSPREAEMEDVFGGSASSLDITAVESEELAELSPVKKDPKRAAADDQIIVNVKPPPVSKSQDHLNEFFNGTESPMLNDSEEEFPYRTPSPQADDLEKEMASLLAQGSQMSGAGQAPLPTKKTQTGVEELDDSLHKGVPQHEHQELDGFDDASVTNKSIVDRIHDARLHDLDKSGSAEDMNYSSTHAHSDWSTLHHLMVQTSLTAEYEVCLGSLCTLSVVCSDLPTEDIGIHPASNGRNRKGKSKRSWLPLELVMGLWNLVLSSENVDSSRVSFVCSKLYEVLVASQHLEILEKGEHGANLPHNNWVRVKKEKIVLLGFALPTSIAHQSEWMKNLAQAIVDDTQFWYGRYALPTIAIAGGDDEARAKTLLRDMDFVQSRLDVIGIVTGTRRHILDCKSYVRAKKQAFKDKLFKSEEYRVETAEEVGNVVALDGCQQVATILYRQGQVLTKSRASTIHMLELATALHLIGMAVGEFGDWEMEMQIYQKTMKVIHECGAFSSECAGDTLLSMGHCSLGQGDFSAAMGCYEEARDMYRNHLGSKSEKFASALHHVGVIHCEKGELETAMDSFKNSLKIKQEGGMKEEYDENTADTLCWIGKVYREKELPDKAKKYFDAAREVKEETCGADSLEVAEILQNIAVLYDDSGDFERSLRYYRRSLKLRRATLGDQHEDVCEIISCIGNVYKAMEDECTALKVFRRACELRESVAKASQLNKQQTHTLIMSYEDVVDILRRQHKTSETPEVEKDEIAAILLKMGHLYDTIGNFSRSDRCFDKALKLRLAGDEKAKAGQVLNVKGISFAKRQKYDEAMAAFEHALLLRKDALGEGHIDVGETLHNMGNCAAKSGDLNEARTYYDEALRIKRKQLGSNSTSVAQTLHNIGNVLVGQGSNEVAMQVYQEALTLRRTVLGNDHVEVAFSLHCIAKINRKQHDVEGARENFNAALRIKRLKLRKNHPSIAETLEQLGSLYMEIGEEDEAALCLNGALNIYKAKHGEGVKVAEVYEQLGAKYEHKDTIGKAIAYYLKSLRVRIRVFGEYHDSVADMHYRIGKLQQDEESYHEALSSFQAATKIRKKTIGRDDLVIADILTDAGKLQLKLNQVDVADKCFAESLRIRNLILDPRHEKIGECLLLNGEVLVQGGMYQEAIGIFQEALSIFQDNSGDFGAPCAEAYQYLAHAYHLTKDYDRALSFYEKCLKVKKGPSKEDSLDVAQVNHGLGEVYFAKGDYRRAEEYFRDSVEVMVSHLGEDHMEVAKTVLSLGRTCTKLNSPDEATMYFEQAKLTKQQHLGDAHLEVAEISLEIGRAHAVKNEYEEAIQAFKSYLRVRRAAVGDDVIVCDVLHEIGTAECDTKQYDAALKDLASALALYRVQLGDEHIKVANTLYSLGVVYEAKRSFKESMKYHKDAFRLRRRLLGQDDLLVAESLDKISSLYMKQPNLEKALHSMKEVLRIQSQQLGKGHVTVGTSLYGMGVIFSETNDLEKAMECYIVSLKIRTEHFGEASIEAAQTLHNIGTVLGKQQDFESALDHWRRALVAYREAGLSDEDYLVAVTIGNINMAEAYLDDVDMKDTGGKHEKAN